MLLLKENRTKLKDGTADIIADGFKKQFGDKKPTKAQEKIMNDFKSLKDIKDPKEYDEKLMATTGAMMLDPYMKTGAADVVEMVSYMRELNKGNNVYSNAFYTRDYEYNNKYDNKYNDDLLIKVDQNISNYMD